MMLVKVSLTAQMGHLVRRLLPSRATPSETDDGGESVALSRKDCSPAFRIYQYWDTPAPPDEVLTNIQTVERAAPEASITLLDRMAAEQLIAQHHGSRAVAAFRACGPPAMQADYLRLCIMDALGGLYLDADDVALKRLNTLVDPVSVGLLVVWLGLVSNSLLFFRSPKHPFISACLALATENIEAQRFDSVLMATGPGVLTAIYCAGDEEREATTTDILSHSPWNMAHWRRLLDHAREVKRRTGVVEESTRELTAIDLKRVSAWLIPGPMSYKTSSRHWANWSESIYQHASERSRR